MMVFTCKNSPMLTALSSKGGGGYTVHPATLQSSTATGPSMRHTVGQGAHIISNL